MATTTPNYGWTVPTSTDLVKDGATAIETLGDAIDASMNTALGTKKAGMVLLNTTSFSAVATQALPTNTFTATYSNYRILIDINTTAVSNDLYIRLRAAGTDNTANNYIFAGRGWQSSGSAFDKNSSGATTAFVVGVSKTSGPGTWIIDLFNPQSSTKQTTFSSFGQWQDGATAAVELPMAGCMTVTTSYDSINLFGGGNLTGTMTCYGYNI
jgi:hypothetical protein